MKKYVYVDEFANDNNLEFLAGEEGLKTKVYEEMISRPSVELAGFYDYFDKNRIIVLGSKENSYINYIDENIRYGNVEKLFSLKPPCVVFSRNVEVSQMFYDLAKKYGVPIFKGYLRTTPLVSKLYTYLQDKLALRLSVHGTFMDISGVGTLIIGKSGVGKSETALDLIKMGHQLVADDLVEILEKEPGYLLGEAPDILKRYLEIRGIGIVDVVSMYGALSYRTRKSIKLVVELEVWDKNKEYDRLGLETKTIKYFDTEITKVTIPILPGRNVALLVESAAVNEKLKMIGFHAAKKLTEKIALAASRGEEND